MKAQYVKADSLLLLELRVNELLRLDWRPEGPPVSAGGYWTQLMIYEGTRLSGTVVFGR